MKLRGSGTTVYQDYGNDEIKVVIADFGAEGPQGPQGPKGDKGDSAFVEGSLTSITGTQDQVYASPNLEGNNYVLSLPQDIATTSSPQFAELKIQPCVYAAGEASVSAAEPTLIDIFDATTYRSAQYFIQYSQGNEVVSTAVLIVHDGIDAALTEYGTIKIGNELSVATDAQLSGGIVHLYAACSTAAPNNLLHAKFSKIITKI